MTDINTTDEGYDVLPATTEPPTADEALTLQDTLADPAALDVAQAPPAPLGRTPAIDFAQQTFIPDTAGGPLMLYGTDTLQQWCEKCCRTRRGENPAVNENFGLSSLFTDLIDGGPFDESAAAEFEDIVSDALTVHPAIDSIEDWEIDYEDGDDACFISFLVIPATGGQDPVEVDLELPATGGQGA